MNRWTNDDFERLSWHDNHVHGLSIREGAHGTGELTLDLDFIVAWSCSPQGTGRFLLAPADLTFHDVSDLKIALDYASSAAGICPFSMQGINRSVFTFPTGLSMFRWHIKVNWPRGELSFSGSGFTQQLRAPAIESTAQYLPLSLRGTPGNVA